MRNILVPTDFSRCADNASSLALKLAIAANSELHFLHTLHAPVDWAKLPLEKEKLFPEVKKQIAEAKSNLLDLTKSAEQAGITAKNFLTFNKGKEEINNHCVKHNHDFIVMGSNGASGIGEILGSNTQKVVRYSKVPVLSVKKDFDTDFKSLVFASTFEDEVIEGFFKVKEFASLLDMKIHLLYVNVPFKFKESDEIISKIEKFQKKVGTELESVHIFNALNVERGILKFSELHSVDVISTATHGTTGVLRLLTSSVTENLINHSTLPVLSVNIT